MVKLLLVVFNVIAVVSTCVIIKPYGMTNLNYDKNIAVVSKLVLIHDNIGDF